VFLVVFLYSRRYETPEKAINPKKSRRSTYIEIFVSCFGKFIRHRLFAKKADMAFSNSPYLYREALKGRIKKKDKTKEVGRWWVGLGLSKRTGGSVDLLAKAFVCQPRAPAHAP
jgi:hypothetical protein